jgi:hypothetical protein
VAVSTPRRLRLDVLTVVASFVLLAEPPRID